VLARFDQKLIAELRLVVRLEVVGLFLELRRLDTAFLVAILVGDVRDPERAVGAVAGGGMVFLGSGGCDRLGGGDEAGDGRAVEEWLCFSSKDVAELYAFLGAVV